MTNRILMPDHRRRDTAAYRRVNDEAFARAKAMRAEFMRAMLGGLISWVRRRSAIAQLNALDDATLKDIGLHRSGIEAAVASSLPVAPATQRRSFPQKPHLCLQRTG